MKQTARKNLFKLIGRWCGIFTYSFSNPSKHGGFCVEAAAWLPVPSLEPGSRAKLICKLLCTSVVTWGLQGPCLFHRTQAEEWQALGIATRPTDA